MPTHFLVQVNNSAGYPNITQNRRYENPAWARRGRDRDQGEVESGDNLLVYCTQDVPTYSMSLAFQISVEDVSEDKTALFLGEPHWFANPLARDRIHQYVDEGVLDEAFRSCGAQGFNIGKLEPHSAEKVLDLLAVNTTEVQNGGSPPNIGSPLDKLIETKLEGWLIEHWNEIDFGSRLKLYEENGEAVGQQYNTREVGIIDILCEDETTQDLVVIELKRGRPSDEVIGQLARYVGWTRDKLANGRKVRGIILAPDFDTRIRYAAQSIPDTQLLRYQTRFEIYPES